MSEKSFLMILGISFVHLSFFGGRGRSGGQNDTFFIQNENCFDKMNQCLLKTIC